jgi:hypothetical protein
VARTGTYHHPLHRHAFCTTVVTQVERNPMTWRDRGQGESLEVPPYRNSHH